MADETLEKSLIAPNGQWELAKGNKKEVWNQTTAFLAQHDPKYKAIHENNKALNAAKAGAKPEKRVLTPPHRPGSFENEGHTTTGKIVQKPVAFKDKEGKTAYSRVNQQEQHHWKWSAGKWNHTHTTHSGEGLNSKVK